MPVPQELALAHLVAGLVAPLVAEGDDLHARAHDQSEDHDLPGALLGLHLARAPAAARAGRVWTVRRTDGAARKIRLLQAAGAFSITNLREVDRRGHAGGYLRVAGGTRCTGPAFELPTHGRTHAVRPCALDGSLWSSRARLSRAALLLAGPAAVRPLRPIPGGLAAWAQRLRTPAPLRLSDRSLTHEFFGERALRRRTRPGTRYDGLRNVACPGVVHKKRSSRDP
mmetsp:Transcript_109546/g.266308  ORF Transcript_109546/g.266308 Transcript_109546/m.266308 type:complete len:226 (+) Transcript_109546:435-1112(+)